MTGSRAALLLLVAAAALLPTAARGDEPGRASASVDVEAPSRAHFSASAGGGYDDNVRLLAPVEQVPGSPVADGFGEARAAFDREPGGDGALVRIDLTGRRFFASDDGELGAGSLHLGWRAGLGDVRLELAGELSAFGWDLFPEDGHVALTLAPALTYARGRLSAWLVPSAVARTFASGTDLEAWARLGAALQVGRLSLWIQASGGGVDAADSTLRRTLARGDLGATLRLSEDWSASAFLDGAVKNLPGFPADAPGEVGRTDDLAGGHLGVRWQLTRALAVGLSADGLWSASTSSVGDYSELGATAGVEWSWEPASWRASRERAPREVRFRVVAPGAREVQLTGDFDGWEPVPMRRDGDGFTAALPLPPGEYRYGFVVDGRWTVPAGARLASDGLGGEDALVAVGGR